MAFNESIAMGVVLGLLVSVPIALYRFRVKESHTVRLQHRRISQGKAAHNWDLVFLVGPILLAGILSFLSLIGAFVLALLGFSVFVVRICLQSREVS